MSFNTLSAAEADAQASINYTCTTGTSSPYITLDAGANGSGSGSSVTRNLKSGSNTIGYNIYQDLAHTTVTIDF